MSNLTLDWLVSQLHEAHTLGNTAQNARDYALLNLAVDYMRKEHQHGYSGENRAETEHHEHLTREQAREWVNGLIGTDPAHMHGGKWSMEDTKPFAQRFGIMDEEGELEFYVIMNAMYADYYEMAKKYNQQNNPMFYADMARAWLHDDDAAPGKAVRYYEYIVRGNE